MKLVFAGTPNLAATLLHTLINSNHDIAAVYTQPDRPAGRGRKIQKSPVKLMAEANNLVIYQPETLKNLAEQEKLATIKPDLMIVVAYGLLLPRQILNLPTFGCINVHLSLLPAWRGASPIQQAILNNDSITGITIMQMDKGLDTGDILAKKECYISNQDTSDTLLRKLAELAQPLLINTIQKILHHDITPIKQDNSKASYAPKILKTDALINWQEAATIIQRKIRAFYPWPVAYSCLNYLGVKFISAEIVPASINNAHIIPGSILHISKLGLDIACGNDSIIRITTLQLPNKNPITINDLLNSKQEIFKVGKTFNNLLRPI